MHRSPTAQAQSVRRPAKDIAVIASTDVLVVGSGPGGTSAAIGAARSGAEVLLVDRYGCLGGNLTQVGVEGIAWYRQQDTVDVEGVGLEFEERAVAAGAAYPEPQSRSHGISAEGFKVVLDDWIAEEGIRPLLHSWVTDVVMDGSRVTGVVLDGKAGPGAILAECVVDATGDADLAHLAGAPTRLTPREEMMAVTVMFSAVGVDKSRFLSWVRENPGTYADWRNLWEVETTGGPQDEMFSPYLDEPFRRAQADGLIPAGLKGIGGTWSGISDAGEATYLNMIHMDGIDGTDPWDLTRGEIEGRRQAMMALEALRRFVPGFGGAGLRNFGMTIGVRDTRKIVGRTELTGDYVRGQGRTDEAVGIFPEFIDGYGVLVLPTDGRYFQVPFGCLVPQLVEGLLIAGRSVAGDKISHASVRNMMCCTVTGQAAGVAAAMAAASGRRISELDLDRVRARLRQQGVRTT